MKKVRCRKEYGVWFYRKILPKIYSYRDFTVYELYDGIGNFINTFISYGDMKYYIETGIILT